MVEDDAEKRNLRLQLEDLKTKLSESLHKQVGPQSPQNMVSPRRRGSPGVVAEGVSISPPRASGSPLRRLQRENTELRHQLSMAPSPSNAAEMRSVVNDLRRKLSHTESEVRLKALLFSACMFHICLVSFLRMVLLCDFACDWSVGDAATRSQSAARSAGAENGARSA